MSGWKHSGGSLIQKGKIMEPLTVGGAIQDCLWVPETVDSADCRYTLVFSYAFTPMMKNSFIGKRLKNTTNKIIITLSWNKSHVNVVSLSRSLIVLFPCCELIKCLHDERKWSPWRQNCDGALGCYWPSGDRRKIICFWATVAHSNWNHRKWIWR